MPSLVKAVTQWNFFNEEVRLNACGKTEAKVEEVKAFFYTLKCPSSEIEKWAQSQFASIKKLNTKYSNLEYVLEHFKTIKESKPE